MLKAFVPVLVTCLIAAPAQARDPAVDLGPGAFVGAQLKLPLGGKSSAKPRAGFAIAPTRSSVSSDGMVRTRIGEGFALNLIGPKPTLTLVGVPADQALGLKPAGTVDTDRKIGVSTIGWVAIGVGTVAILYLGAATWCLETNCTNSE